MSQKCHFCNLKIIEERKLYNTLSHIVQKKGEFLYDTHETALQKYTNFCNLTHIIKTARVFRKPK